MTGDGDHWTNINMGFENLVKNVDRLETMELSDEFKEIGKIMMSVIGGSSGVLYGSAYIAAAKAYRIKGNAGCHRSERSGKGRLQDHDRFPGTCSEEI